MTNLAGLIRKEATILYLRQRIQFFSAERTCMNVTVFTVLTPCLLGMRQTFLRILLSTTLKKEAASSSGRTAINYKSSRLHVPEVCSSLQEHYNNCCVSRHIETSDCQSVLGATYRQTPQLIRERKRSVRTEPHVYWWLRGLGT